MDNQLNHTVKFTFSKDERLCELKQIESLFTNGQSFSLFPFRVVYIKTGYNDKYPARVLFSVSKRLFKNAVDRNNIKRKIREAYRKNKHTLYSGLQHHAAIVIIYKSKEKQPDYNYIENRIKQTINELIKNLNK